MEPELNGVGSDIVNIEAGVTRLRQPTSAVGAGPTRRRPAAAARSRAGIARASLAARERLGGLELGARAPADRGRAGLPHGVGQLRVARGVGLGDQRDHVGQLRDRVEVAQRRQAREPERVQLVSEQQRQVRVRRCARREAGRSAVASPRGSSRAAARTRPRARARAGRRPRSAAGRRGRSAPAGSLPSASTSPSAPPSSRQRRPQRLECRSRRSSSGQLLERRPGGLDGPRRRHRRCAPATGTRPRTAMPAGTRRARAAPRHQAP